MKVTRKEFVKAWRKSKNLTDVVYLTGLTRNSAQVRASQLRRWGYRLKMFRRGRPKVNA